MNVFLVGPMGAGKTTIGKKLASMLGRKFYDSDLEIESRAGADLSWIFDVEGEEGFRKREIAIIKELSGKENIVLSTGGGTVLVKDNREVLASSGVIIYLKADIEQQVSRTTNTRNRPILRDIDNPYETLSQLMEEREVLYKQIASKIIKTDGRGIKVICNNIIDFLNENQYL